MMCSNNNCTQQFTILYFTLQTIKTMLIGYYVILLTYSYLKKKIQHKKYKYIIFVIFVISFFL